MKSFNDTLIVFGYIFVLAILASFFYKPVFEILAQNNLYLVILFIVSSISRIIKEKRK